MPDNPGALAKVMDIITNAGISIEYMYAFSSGKIAVGIIRPDNLEKTIEILSLNQVELLASSELFSL
jgi:hypothetical protein